MVDQTREFGESCGLGLEVLSEGCPLVFACEVVVGEGLVRHCSIVDCFQALGSGSDLFAEMMGSFVLEVEGRAVEGVLEASVVGLDG